MSCRNRGWTLQTGWSREWERLIVGYLCLLAQWLWEDPKIPRGWWVGRGLCYGFNREITRSTIHPIISRFGADMLIGQMTRFSEDDRFISVTPGRWSRPGRRLASALALTQNPVEQEGEIWFDWVFVDFWKSNHCPSAESVMLISSLRDVIRTQRRRGREGRRGGTRGSFAPEDSRQLILSEATSRLPSLVAPEPEADPATGTLYFSECYLPLHPDPKPESLFACAELRAEFWAF
ncbi:hypothetical protein HD554DRAFT_1166813 [Boletus coccyginus]|nr:hypothetical protein HD554DRAFT_1166813 [Boletus coccyginus]